MLKRVSLHCLDTSDVNRYYEIKIPEIYFSFTSWKDLIFKKKMIVDSLAVIQPEIYIRVRKYQPIETQQQRNFQTDDILNFLQKTLAHFNAHSFGIKDLSLTFSLPDRTPFHADSISLKIVNFAKIDNNDKHVLGSDTISISMGRQSWAFPDGIHEISFKRLNFFSATQKVELDSFSLRQKSTVSRPGVIIHGEKFFFNSSHLPAIYQKNQLIIDTLYCLNPSLTVINSSHQNTTTEKATDSTINQTVSHALFKLISVKYIDIIDGSYHLKKNNADTSKSGANKSSAVIYNLVLDNANHKSLTTDSLKINVKDVQFYSNDSMSKIKMAELKLQGKDAVFSNVKFIPSELNRHKRGIIFTAPEFLLRNIDIGELLNKRLKSQSGLLIHPVILFHNNPEKSREANPVLTKKENKMTVFMRSLHRIKNTINVDSFGISNGIAKYKIEGTKPLQLKVNKLNATILLNKLFKSDSLIDIKHSIPNFQMGDLILQAKNIHIKVSNYRLDGVNHRNWGDRLVINMSTGTTISGNDIYWESFDWEVFENTKAIQIDLLRIGNLVVRPSIEKKPAPRPGKARKNLPEIRIGKLDVNKINFTSSSPKNNIRFAGNNLQIEKMRTDSHFFRWSNAKVNISNAEFTGVNHTASIKNILFDSQKETLLKEIKFYSDNDHGKTKIYLPLIKIRMQINSNDFSHIAIDSITSSKGSVDLLTFSKAKKQESKSLSLPNLLLGKLRMKDLAVHYATENNKDSMSLKALFNIEGTNIRSFKNSQQSVSYKKINIENHSVQLDKKNIHVDLPHTSIQLKDGHLSHNKSNLSLQSFIEVVANNASFNYQKDSTELYIKKFGFEFLDPAFHFQSGHKLYWKNLADKVTMKGDGLSYKGKKINIKADSYTVNPSSGKLNIKNFSILPTQDRDSFFKHSEWQNDYMNIIGKSMSIVHFKINNSPEDTSLHIQKIIADGIDLNISRDKSIPFQHGIFKMMPTKLIEKIPVPLTIDSLILSGNNVKYHEFSVATKQWSTIPLTNLNGNITNITNYPAKNDSLKISAGVNIFDNHIYHFTYHESYSDSLSGFIARYNMSPGNLTRFSQFSKPLAAVDIVKGRADTVFANWKGNKYLAFGKMNFYYSGLRIKVYSKKNLSRQGLIPSVETFFANLILPNKRRKTSIMYFVRDREKFVFNYWIKTQVSGILSTFGIKKEKKLKQAFEKNSKAFYLAGE